MEALCFWSAMVLMFASVVMLAHMVSNEEEK